MKTDKEKELDDLFREGLENPAPNANFREDDWDAMEAMLDKDKKRAGIIYWAPVIAGIAAMLFIALAFFLSGRKNEPAIVKTMPVKQPVHNGQGISKTQDSGLQQQASLPVIANTTPSATGSTNVAEAGAAKPVKNKTATAQYAINHPLKKHANVSSRNGGQTNNGITDGPALNNQILVAIAPVLNVQDLNNAINTDIAFPDPAPKPQIVSVPVKDKKAIKNSSYSRRPQLAITVLASPDINGVNSFQNSKVGTNVGMLFSLGISKRFSISTGALYSRKPYLTDFSNYHTAFNFKTDPENVSADCRVLDIPINIDYLVYNKSNNKFSIGSGLSSYLMLRESYHYNYEYPSTVGPTDYNIINKNRHFLGVLNLDASYYRRVNSKFSIGVEPYLKIPLTNIGASQVKLQSTGMAVGITWNLNSPQKL